MSDLLRKWMQQDVGVTVPINNFEKVRVRSIVMYVRSSYNMIAENVTVVACEFATHTHDVCLFAVRHRLVVGGTAACVPICVCLSSYPMHVRVNRTGFREWVRVRRALVQMQFAA